MFIEGKNVYLPGELDQQSMWIRSLVGEFSSVQIDNFTNPQEVLSAINLFLYRKGVLASLNSRVKNYLKKDARLPDGNFVFSSAYYRDDLDKKYIFLDDYEEDGRGYTKPEGDFGYAIGLENGGRPTWLAVTTFSPITDLDNAPIIRQLQAYCYGSEYFPRTPNALKKAQTVKDVLAAFRWEFLLTDLTIEFAEMIGSSKIYMQNGSMAEDVDKYSRFTADQAYLRYDVTARKCGFKKIPGGYYYLPLAV